VREFTQQAGGTISERGARGKSNFPKITYSAQLTILGYKLQNESVVRSPWQKETPPIRPLLFSGPTRETEH